MSMKHGILTAFCAVLALCLSAAVFAPLACAQSRVSDKDVQTMMKNLRDDAKSFRPVFDAAIKKSTIRKTSKAKDAKALAARFEQQTQGMLQNFKHTKNGDAAFSEVTSTAHEIHGLVTSLQLGPQVTSRWERIHTELRQISNALGT